MQELRQHTSVVLHGCLHCQNLALCLRGAQNCAALLDGGNFCSLSATGCYLFWISAPLLSHHRANVEVGGRRAAARNRFLHGHSGVKKRSRGCSLFLLSSLHPAPPSPTFFFFLLHAQQSHVLYLAACFVVSTFPNVHTLAGHVPGFRWLLRGFAPAAYLSTQLLIWFVPVVVLPIPRCFFQCYLCILENSW